MTEEVAATAENGTTTSAPPSESTGTGSATIAIDLNATKVALSSSSTKTRISHLRVIDEKLKSKCESSLGSLAERQGGERKRGKREKAF